MNWNLSAEIVSLLFAFIFFINAKEDKTVDTQRRRIFLITYMFVFLSIIMTISSTFVTAYFQLYPIWFVEIITTLYFISLPLPVVTCFRFVISLLTYRRQDSQEMRKWSIAWLPYVVYTAIIIMNASYGYIFEIHPTIGYIRTTFYALPYAVIAVYFAGILGVIVKYYRIIGREKAITLVCTMIGVAGILGVQFVLPEIILTGTTAVVAVLILQTYIRSEISHKDKLTSLNNRDSMILDMLQEVRGKRKFAMVVVSLRNFKRINENLGLSVGDSLLEEFGGRLEKLCKDLAVYRYSGDEFAILYTPDRMHKLDTIDQMIETLSSDIQIEEHTINLTIIYTRVDFPEFGRDVKSLISAADYSIFSLKNSGEHETYMYDISIRDKMNFRSNMIEKLRQSIMEDDIVVFYQPIYSVEDKCCSQAEALVRLRKNEKDLIYPDQFIQLAEESGLIVELTYLIFERVCRDYRTMVKTYGENFVLKSISINFPYLQFMQENLVERLDYIIQKYNIHPSNIKIEITERTLVSNANRVTKVMDQLRDRGFQFELDDFGVEYSNISLFLSLPVDIIKLDRSLLLTAFKDEMRRQFFEHLVSGMKAMKATIVAEGVEELADLEYLEACGCDYIQGYYFSRPLPFNEFCSYLLDNQNYTKRD